MTAALRHRARSDSPLVVLGIVVALAALLLASSLITSPRAPVPENGVAAAASHSLSRTAVGLSPAAPDLVSGVGTSASTGAGQVLASVLTNYNASIPSNIAYRLLDWVVGSPAQIPGSNLVWYPTYPRHVAPYPEPTTAPVLLFNNATAQFVGTVPNLANASALAYDPANGFLYATLPANNSVAVYNPSTRSWVEPALRVGVDPSAIILDPKTNELFVANQGSSNLSIISGSTNRIVGSGVAVGQSPVALADDPYAGVILVANENSSNVSSVNISSHAIRSLLVVGNPTGLAYSAVSGNLLVTIPSRPIAVLLNASTLAVLTTANTGSGASSVATVEDGSAFAVSNGPLDSIDTFNSSSGTTMNLSIPVGVGPTQVFCPFGSETYTWAVSSRNVTETPLTRSYAATGWTGETGSTSLNGSFAGLAYDPALDRVYAADVIPGAVAVLNGSTFLTAAPPIRVPNHPIDLIFDAATSTLYAAGVGSVISINSSSDTIVGQSAVSAGVYFDVLVDAHDGKVWAINNRSGLTAFAYPGPLGAGQVVGIAKGNATLSGMTLDPSNGDLYIADRSNNTVAVVNASTGTVLNDSVDAGAEVTSVAYDPVDQTVYALGTEVTLIDPSANNRVRPTPVVIPVHGGSNGIVYDPSREFVYALTILGAPALGGNVTAIDGSSIGASYASSTSIPVGQLPVAAIPVALPGPSSPGFSDLWVSNLFAGTINVIGSDPQISSFLATPSAVDAGHPVQFVVVPEGGSSPLSIDYSGLPSGCSSADTWTLNCIPTDSPGTFTVNATVTDGLGFSISSSAELTVYASPAISVDIAPSGPGSEPGSPGTWDVGESLTATAAVTGGSGAVSYNWSFGDGSGSTAASPTFTFGAPGNYPVEVTATDALGGVAVGSSLVTIVAVPSVAIRTSTPVTDRGFPMTLAPNVTGGDFAANGSIPASWSFGDGTFENSTGPVDHVWEAAGTFTVSLTVTDRIGNRASVSTSVVVEPALSGGATYSDLNTTHSTAWVGDTFAFVASPSGGDAPYTVVWGFGDGTNATAPSIEHAFAEPGTYNVTFQIRDELGAVVRGSWSISVIAAPNGSPSGSSGGSSTFNWTDLALGLVVGAAAGTTVVYLASRSRRRPPPTPPTAYVPPATVSGHPWKED